MCKARNAIKRPCEILSKNNLILGAVQRGKNSDYFIIYR